MSPAVTVIIPTWQGAAMLEATLASVLLQDFGDFEVQVVGDGCTDASEQVVAAAGDPRLHWVNLPRNTGTPAAPRNEGLARARGRFIAYLGHDDLWLPWHLRELVPLVDSGADVAYGLGALVGPRGAEHAIGRPGPGRALSPSTWLHRRELAARVGPWSIAVRRGVDVEYEARVQQAGATVRCGRRLGVLQFPSWRWRPYAPGATLPQPEWLQAIRADAIALEHRALLDLAAHLSERPANAGDEETGWAAALHRLRRAFLRDHGHRWPLRPWLEGRSRRRRGLSA